MSLKITILGCGNSAGTPAIGNHWGNCDPQEPKNRRSRPSIAVQSANATLIVDTGPDFRDQLNREDIHTVDAVLYTHAHGDHVCGIDDLRVLRFRSKKLIPIFGHQEALEEISQRFSYLFTERSAIYPEVVSPQVIEHSQYGREMRIDDIPFIPFEQDHGTCKTLGFRFGDAAYSTDVVRLDDRALETLSGIKTWIVDAAGYKMEENIVHFTLKQVIALNEKIGAQRVYLTHMTPAMDYQRLLKELPPGFEPAYDGLVIEA